MTKVNRTIGVRLKSQRGFSLMETLAVILVMTLVGIMMATGIPAAQKSYTGAMDGANAESVLFTTVEQLRSKLSVAAKTVDPNQKSEAEGKVICSYEDVESGVYTSIVQKPDGLYIDRWSGIDEGETPKSERLIPAALERGASERLIVQFKSDGGAGIDRDPSTGMFTISGLEVVRDGETAPLAELDTPVTVKPIVAG